MKQPYYKIQNKSESEADILMYGIIGNSWLEESVTAKRFIADFKELEKTCSRINIHINSPGGSVFDGLAIFNAIQNSSTDVHTYNDGLAASMGAVILLSGKTVHSAKNALMMLHSPMGGAYGHARNIQSYLKVLDKVKGSLVSCICAKSGQAEAEIEKKYFDFEDHWMSAEEAKAEGMIDEVEERETKVPENIKNMNYAEIVDQFGDLLNNEEPKRFNVLNWLNNLLTNTKNNDEMNLTELIKACSLDDKATEKDVLEHIQNIVSENATLREEKGKTDTALQSEQDEHKKTKNNLQEAQEQIENLKKEPGESTASVVETNGVENKFNFLDKQDVEFFKML